MHNSASTHSADRAHLESLERKPSASAREKSKALEEKGEINPDDGGKVNYNKFGAR